MLAERHELNKIALLELKKDVEKTREYASYFSKMADLLLFLNEIYRYQLICNRNLLLSKFVNYKLISSCLKILKFL